jgi:hypothetical protein
MNVGELLIRISADTSGVRDGVRDARREVDRLPDEHRIRIIIDQGGGAGGRGSIAGAAGNLGRMRVGMQGVISLAPILAAGIQAVVGAVGGLVSMLGDATIGTVSFGAVATAVLNDVIDAQKEITKATEDMKKAMTEDEKQTALENMAKAYRGLSEEQLAALSSLQRFKAFWDDYTSSFEKPVVIAFSQALEGFQYLIESLRPTVAAASNAILKVFQTANQAMKGSDFTKFFASLAQNVGPVLETFGYIAIDVMQGLLNIMRAFEPVSGAMQGGLRGLSQAFLQWTKSLDSEKIKQFMEFVIQVGPQFIGTFTELMGVLMPLLKILGAVGAIMLGLVNIALAAFNAFTAMALGWDSARSKADALKNSVFTLWNTLKMLAGYKVSSGSGSPADSIFDVDKAWQDWFGSIGDVTGGLKDAKKAADGFLASFDEVHSINKEDGGGLEAPSIPKPPSIPSTPGNPWNQPEMDEPQPGGTDWIQNLIDKMKELAKFIPLKLRIDPPDDGGTGIATMIDGLKAGLDSFRLKLAEQPPAMVGVSLAWQTMLNKMQTDLNAYRPYLEFGLSLLGINLDALKTPMESTSTNWKAMLDNMQSKLNAYRPYLEFGLTLLGAALGDLQSAQLLLETSWGKSWQTMYINQLTQSNKMISTFEAVQRAFVAMQQTIGQPVTAPAATQGHPAGGNQPIMDDLVSSSPAPTPVAQPTGSTLKSLWENSAYVKAMSALSKTSFMEWLGKHPELGSGVGIGGAFLGAGGALTNIGSNFMSKVVQIWQSLQGSGLGGAITGFAGGGIIGSDSIVRVGEQGRREAIIPLETSAMQPFANAIASSMGGGNGGVSGDIYLQIDGVTFARLTAPYGFKESQRIGGNMISTT